MTASVSAARGDLAPRTAAEFDQLGEMARKMGFQKVASGPFVRSSYHARDMAEA